MAAITLANVTPIKQLQDEEPTVLYNPSEHIAHTIMLYSQSGLWKTGNALEFCRWTLINTGKICRYVYSDEGGSEQIRNAEKAGLIQAIYLGQGASAMAMASKLAKGEWPDDKGVWRKITERDNIGGYVFDSITTLCNLVMHEISKTGRHLAGDPKDHALKFTLHGETIANYTRANYTIAQFVARTVLTGIASLPVERVLITAREYSGEDNEGQPVWGPATAGKALIKDIPSSVGDIFHLTSHRRDDGEVEFRMWFAPHPSPTPGVNWFSKPRLDREGLMALRELHPEGYITVGIYADEGKGRSISYYLDHQKKYSQESIDRDKDLVSKYLKK